MVTTSDVSADQADRADGISPTAPTKRSTDSSKRGAVFVDLDRTLLRGASGPVIDRALRDEGLLDGRPQLPARGLLYGFYDLFGETLPMMALVRSAAHFVKGWSEADFRHAGERAAPILAEMVQPFARGVLEEHKEQGRVLVLCTTTPADLVAPLAELTGFDDVVATRYARSQGTLSGGIEGDFVWGVGKLSAPRRWARDAGIDFSVSHAYSDSVYDVPLLRAVGHPHALKPDARLRIISRTLRWPIEHWDRPAGVPRIAGVEPYHLFRVVVRPEAFPYRASTLRGQNGSRHQAQCSWRPTTAATSTSSRSHSWQHHSDAPCVFSPRGSCSTLL